MTQIEAIVSRLMALHPKRIDLSLDRVQRLLAALHHHGARVADRLGRFCAASSGRPPLALGVEEQRVVRVAARALVLPFPQLHDRTG